MKQNKSRVDVDGNGFVEWEEFCVLMYRKVMEDDLIKQTYIMIYHHHHHDICRLHEDMPWRTMKMYPTTENTVICLQIINMLTPLPFTYMIFYQDRWYHMRNEKQRATRVLSKLLQVFFVTGARDRLRWIN